MIQVNNIKVPLDYDEKIIKSLIEKKIKGKINKYQIVKKAVDARKEVCFVMNFLVEVNDESKYLDLIVKPKKPFVIPNFTKQPIIIGAGPAGLFAGLIFAYAGAKPIIFERGKSIKEREKDILNFLENRTLNKESNLVYGLGGAGTYSDGKLTTNVNSEYIDFILHEFVKFGAPEEILYLSKPHIGTDILKKVVSNMALEIEKHGQIFYEHKFVGFDNNKVYIEHDGERKEYYTDALVLSIGHSAKDTFQVLKKQGLLLEQKPFSIGVRIEHTQKQINDIQYGKYSGHKNLPNAEYKMAVHLEDRDVYTFCMCPGGEVVPSMNEEKTMVTNGMSYHKRDLENANAALLVNVLPSDYESDDPLAGFAFQEKYEKLAFQENYKAPISRVEDFLNDRISTHIGFVKPSYKLGYVFADLRKCLPKFSIDALKKGIVSFDRKMKGFNNPDAILTGIESRSSCPVRIKRNERYQTNIPWIYPCGEGSGYSGGITTSAIDGIKIALQIIQDLANNVE